VKKTRQNRQRASVPMKSEQKRRDGGLAPPRG
jgi:hypothetical protein